jgi:hypothetical protein
MVFIKRCSTCNKILLFNSVEYNASFFCNDCIKIKKDEELKKMQKDEEDRKSRIEKKKARRKMNDELADINLKKELYLEKRKQGDRLIKKNQKEQLKRSRQGKDIDKEDKTPKKPVHSSNKTYFSDEEIKNNDRLLYIEADLKKILAIDWLKGKKKVMVNKERELRRTHAGGFSAEKFQKFVDFKKKKTFDWIVSVLERPGIIRKPYDIIRVSSPDETLKKEIEKFIEGFD